jgi:hypothetical protein
MKRSDWRGVFPAITTPFKNDHSIDHDALGRHISWLIDSGCGAMVPLGSLGESATLTFAEKVAILRTCVAATEGRVPVIAGIAGLATAECVALAREAERVGCGGIMALPAYVYYSDWYEASAHYSAIIGATSLSTMLYNNPIAYRTDVTAPQLAELAEKHENLHAMKESSGDVRRVSAVREALGDRLAIFCGARRHDPRGDSRGGERLDCRIGECPSRGVRARLRSCDGRPMGASDRALSLVPAAVAYGHRAEVRAADQAGAGGSGPRHDDGTPATLAARR